jgi:integrator complex subunit 11
MTYPTKAIAPILLQDFRRVVTDRKKDDKMFSEQDVKNCMKKVTPLNLHQTFTLNNELEITPYYAGHVLGAALFHVKDLTTGKSVVYTGDFNMTPDRHLGRASIDRLYPDLLITETTYATTIRDSKNSRERDFLHTVHSTVENGGKVLIPVFALGRAQELCILLETYWDRMNLKVPIYFSAGLVEKANVYYKLFINWTNQKIKETFVKRNMFDFKHIQSFDKSIVDNPGPCVLFATPGMLHAGMSLEVFKKWGGQEKNCCILPGYCVAGTFGNTLLRKKTGRMEIDKKTVMDVKCHVTKISFSAHADAKGILDLIGQVSPKNIMLVHGEKQKMALFKQKIESDLKIKTFDPANGQTIQIESEQEIKVNISMNLVKRSLTETDPRKKLKINGVLVTKDKELPRLLDPSEACKELGMETQELDFVYERAYPHGESNMFENIVKQLKKIFDFKVIDNEVMVESVKVKGLKEKITISWSLEDDVIGEKVAEIVDEIINSQLSQSK